MPPNTAWPPPPDTPDPLAAHDEFLTALLRAPATKPPLSRMGLYRALSKATELDLRQCVAVVNDFCDRQGVFPQLRGWRLWLLFLPSLVCLCLAVTVPVILSRLDRLHRAALTHTARSTVTREILGVTEAAGAAFIVVGIGMLLMVKIGTRRTRREAEEAREKALGQDRG